MKLSSTKTVVGLKIPTIQNGNFAYLYTDVAADIPMMCCFKIHEARVEIGCLSTEHYFLWNYRFSSQARNFDNLAGC